MLTTLATSADDDRLANRDEAGRRRDRHQADHRADAGAQGRRLRPLHPVEEHPAEHRGGRGRVGRRERQRRRAGGRHRRAGVEAEPAEPEHAGAENHERDVGRVVALVGEMALPATQDHRSGQRREARRHVHHRPAGEVHHAPLVQDPVGMPRPVRQRRVDEQAEQDHEQQIGREPHPLGERARDQGRRDDRELELKHREDQQRNRRRQRGVSRFADAVEHEERQRIADHAADVVAERQAEADHDPDKADDAQRDHALKHRRDDVLEADHAAVEERQPRRHQQHQTRGRQHPGDVARVALAPLRAGRSPSLRKKSDETKQNHRQEREQRKHVS